MELLECWFLMADCRLNNPQSKIGNQKYH